MSGYPPPNSNIGFATPHNNFGNNPPPQPYPPSSSDQFSTTYPYPSTHMNMSGDNSGYPGTGYPPQNPGYPNAGGYPPQVSPMPPQVSPMPPQVSPMPPQVSPMPPQVSPMPPQVSPMPPQVCPTAPDLSQMQKIPGYEHLTFEEEIVMPPTLPPWQPETHERRELESLPRLSEDDVREAAVTYVGENCCYGSAPVRNMVITDISMMSAFHYKLETFSEKRESAWRFVPYTGQPIDGPMNGPAPGAWDVHATPPQMFKDGKITMEVPHTAFVKPCHTCVGNGRVRCDSCHGNGRNNCTWCKGRGVRSNFDNDMCTSCNGTGHSRCTWCDATGQVKCKTCNGKGQLKGYVELIITWTNHVDDYISETSSMPKELVRQVTGQTAFEEEYPRVFPLSHAPDEAVRNASNELINKHGSAYPNERILKQRHVLRLIPIGQVRYQWNEKAGLYYVYGYEHKVYFENYPRKCCCCTII